MAQRAGEKSWEAAISGRRWWNPAKPGFDLNVFWNAFDVQPGFFMTTLYLEALAGHCSLAFSPDGDAPGWCSSGPAIPAGSIRSGPFRSAWSASEVPCGRSRGPRPMPGNGWWRRWSRSGRCGSGFTLRSAAQGYRTIPVMPPSPGNGAPMRPRRMFIFLQNQGLGSIPLAFAIFVAAHLPGDGLRPADYLGALILFDRHCGRGAGGCATQGVPDRSRQQGQGLRRRAVALVAPSQLFLRMVRVAGLSRHRAFRSVTRLSYPWGLPRCWARSSCTGSWSTSPASRRWKSRCCARAAIAIATTSRAPAGSFRCRRHDPGSGGWSRSRQTTFRFGGRACSKARAVVTCELRLHASSAPSNGGASAITGLTKHLLIRGPHPLNCSLPLSRAAKRYVLNHWS